MRYRFLLVPILVTALAAPASAGIIFGKKPKVVPEKRVPELLLIVKNDGDENKRYDAVEELREYDAKQFPEIVPVLIDVLTNDKKPAVRSEAAQTLSKLRPPSKVVADALEQARDKDPSFRVRTQARHSLLSYHWVEWWYGDPSKVKKEGTLAPTTKEPPLAPPVVATPMPPIPPMPTQAPPLVIVPTTRLKPKPDPTYTPPLAPVIVTPPAPVIPPSPLPPRPLLQGPDLGPQQ